MSAFHANHELQNDSPLHAARPAGRARGRAPFLSQICSGLLPMLYRIDRKPDWNVFLNMAAVATGGTRAAAAAR